jgi:hypothetical protein
MKCTRKEFFRHTLRRGLELLSKSYPLRDEDARSSRASIQSDDLETLYRAAIRRGIDPATMPRDDLRRSIEELEDPTE